MHVRERTVVVTHTECVGSLSGLRKNQWIAFVQSAGLEPDFGVERTVLVWDDETLVAAGSRQRNVLKCIAVDESHQGEGLTATVLTQLRQDAFSAGYKHLFLYTKPKNQHMFSSLFFYPVVKTENVLLMENVKGGVTGFLSGLEVPCREGNIGAIVMHCNPFTKGHRYLIETAAKQCDHLYLFILSEEQSIFPAKDRMELVRQGTADLNNVTVHPTGQYLISFATFPTYFLKDKASADNVHCQLDMAVFTQYFVPHFGITHRFVGTEPNCPVTNRYNEAMKTHLPKADVSVKEIPRLEQDGTPISASTVRSLLQTNQKDVLRKLIPDCTWEYLINNEYI